MNLPEILTVKQVADYLQVGRHKIYELIYQHKIPAVKLGSRTVRVPREGLMKAIADGGIFQGDYSIERRV